MKQVFLIISMFLTSSIFLDAKSIIGRIDLVTGNINFRTGTAPSANRNADTNATTAITIDSVVMYFAEGTLAKIRVYADQGGNKVEFQNEKRPIPISTWHKGSPWDLLVNSNNSQQYIYVGYVIRYLPAGPHHSIPDDGMYVLKTGTTSVNLTKESMIQVDLKEYSDILGLVEEEPNGLVQLQGKAKIITNTNNLILDQPIYLLQYIEPHFYTAKFNDEYSTSVLPSDSVVDRMDLLQKSPFALGVNVNLIKYFWPSGSSISLNSGYQYNKYKLQLVHLPDSTKFSNSLNAFLLQAKFHVQINEVASINYTPGLMWQKFAKTTATSKFRNINEQKILVNTLDLVFDFSKDNKLTTYFIRFNVFNNLSNNINSFTQLQLGVNQELSSLF